MSEVFDIRQEIPGFEAAPGIVPEMSEEIRQTLARVILDETVEIVTNNRRAQVRYDGLKEGAFAELFRPLVDVLALDPSVDKPPLRVSIDRASKLGLVPSQKAIYERTTLSKIQSNLGFRPKFRFQDWMKADYVLAGKRLARIVGGRPTRFDIQAAGKGEFSNLGDFPTVDEVKGRFGRLAIFHELIGYPSCRGWVDDDYMDWSVAFYRQNPDATITARNLDNVSAAGLGPSRQAIYSNYGSLSKFQDLSRQHYETVTESESIDREQRVMDAIELSQHEPTLSDAIAEFDQPKDQSRILQISAQFRLARHFITDATPSELRDMSLIKSPDVFTRHCMNKASGSLRAADVEAVALAFGVFDDLWPMYRFQEVRLSLVM
ncbi:hypothetical protein KC968_01700 [Candidatus Saccharibacteria bacterium]|nr:hypothetical protein [Candidatus Saccharibacteria bacterium]